MTVMARITYQGIVMGSSLAAYSVDVFSCGLRLATNSK